MDIYTLTVIFLAVGAGALAKGATGMGMPLIAIPFIAAMVGFQHAVVALAIPIFFSNLWQVYKFRGARYDPALRFLVPMLIACAFGVAGGVWFLTTVSERSLSLMLGILLLCYVTLRLLRPSFTLGKKSAMRFAAPAGLATGVLHGATGISAPIGVTFIHAQRFAREAHIFAVSAMFLALAISHIPSLWLAGLMRPEWVAHGFFSLIPMALFMPVGQFLSSKLSAKAFDHMILVFLGVMGIKLLFVL